MFTKLPTVLTADELLDVSIKRTQKITIPDRNKAYQNKKTIIARTDSFATSIITRLEQYVKEFPSIDQLPLFYQELIDIKIDNNQLKKSLGAINWAHKISKDIYMKQKKSLKKTGNQDFLHQKQKEIYGRISSVVKQVDKDLKFLIEAQKIMVKFPDIRDLPTIVIAGYPNVGKSSLLRCLSSAKPIVAQYPFTTKQVHVGHIIKTDSHIETKYQIIDTPGLLDRPFSKRNTIEKQAISALTHLADLILFVVDPTETCGYSQKDQQQLLCQIKKIFSDTPIIQVENKADIKNTSSSSLKISCEKNEGINDLLDRIFELMEEK